MDREQVVVVAKLVGYLLIIAGIIMLFSAIMYLITVPGNLVVVGWVIIGALMLGIGATGLRYIKKLRLDIKYKN
jgi:divalent metal cation (Fe/Co/Zn/Cd) transporter